MRKLIWISWLALLIAACGQTEQPAAEQAETDEPPATESAPAPGERRGQAEAKIGGAEISIDYGRPVLEGRDMLSRLAAGQVWRLGMDRATHFNTSQDLNFGGTAVPAGEYTLFARKNSATDWTLLVNSMTGIWGTAYDGSSDIAEIPLARSQSSDQVERFTAAIEPTGDNGGELVFRWDTLVLRAAFTVGG